MAVLLLLELRQTDPTEVTTLKVHVAARRASRVARMQSRCGAL